MVGIGITLLVNSNTQVKSMCLAIAHSLLLLHVAQVHDWSLDFNQPANIFYWLSVSAGTEPRASFRTHMLPITVHHPSPTALGTEHLVKLKTKNRYILSSKRLKGMNELTSRRIFDLPQEKELKIVARPTWQRGKARVQL